MNNQPKKRKPGRPRTSPEGELVPIRTFVEPNVQRFLKRIGGTVYAGAQQILRKAAADDAAK